MTPEEWNEGMSNLDMDLIEDHILQQDQLIRGNRANRIWLRLGAAAACLALLAGVFFLTPRPGVSPDNPTALGPGDLVTIPTDPRPENPVTDPSIPTTPPVTLPPDIPTTPPATLPPDIPTTPPATLPPDIPTTPTPDDPITPPPDDPIPPPPDDPIVLPPLQFDRYSELSGSSLEFVKGSSTAVVGSGQPEEAPPEFTFFPYQFTVVARVAENYPDTYYQLDVSSTYKPAGYRLVRMELMQTLNGKNLPKEFLYLLPEDLYVDMSVYDCLLIAMDQLGTENYVLRNGTQNRMEACPLPLFDDCRGQPELGGIIAFTDGIFDESLWQNESWRYGYQFGKYYLDNPTHGNLVVRRGGSLEETIANINQKLDSYGQSEPSVITLDFKTQAARDALALVMPFENGVFSQSLTGERLTFRRYINGCQTEETVTIDLSTEEVTYSQVRYTPENMENLQNIALYLSEQAAAYVQNSPTPPHTDPEGKKLLCLNLYAWYAKVDGKLYGVVKTAWRYCENDDWYIQYYDDQYVLFDMTDGTGRDISRDDLLALLGDRNVYTGPYGLGEQMPMC